MTKISDFGYIPEKFKIENRWFVANCENKRICEWNEAKKDWTPVSEWKDKKTQTLKGNRIFAEVKKDIIAHYQHYLFPALYLDDSDGIVFVDFDNVFDSEGKLCEEVADWVKKLGTYTEISASGNGLHCFVAVKDKSIFPQHEERKENPYKDFVGRNTEKPSGIEIYTKKKSQYAIMTGNLYNYRLCELNQDVKDHIILDMIDYYDLIKPERTTQKRETGEVREYDDLKSQVLAVADLRGMFEEAYPGHPINGENMARCPWHNDTNPSLHFDSKNGFEFCHCFSCEKHLNAIDLFMEINNLSFGEALREMALELGLVEKEPTPVEVSLPDSVVSRVGELNEKYKNEEVAEEDYEEKEEEEKDMGLVLPPFPLENVMSGVAKNFTEFYSESLPEIPPQFFYMGFLNSFSAYFDVVLNSAIKTEPRFYLLFLGESGRTRKSEGLRQIQSFFRNYLPEMPNVWGNGYGSAEGLAKELEEKRHLIYCIDELQSFMRKASNETSVLLPMITNLFDGTLYQNTTKKSKIYIDDVHLSVIGASTVETFQECWKTTHTNIGLDNRFFLVPGSGKRIGIPEPLDTQKLDWLCAEVKKTYNKMMNVKKINISREAKFKGNAYTKDFNDSPFRTRLDNYLYRLAMAICLSDGVSNMDETHIEKASLLCEWQYDVREILTPISADNTIAYMEQSILKVLKNGTFTKAKIQNWLKKAIQGKGTYAFEKALSNLVNGGYIRKVKTPRSFQFELTR